MDAVDIVFVMLVFLALLVAVIVKARINDRRARAQK
jgi:hypothetical protein